MKSTHLIFGLIIFFLFACTPKNHLFEEMPEGDLIALEGMETAYENALVYNDSLKYCSTGQINCDTDSQFFYDDLFHQYDEMFSLHHNNYSHNNTDDDHHHEQGHNILHGWMMNGHHRDETEHGYEHDISSFEIMTELRESHEQVHPR